MKNILVILFVFFLSGCGFSLYSIEKNINFSSADNEYRPKEWQFTSEYVLDNMIEHRPESFPNNSYVKKFEYGAIKMSFERHYMTESKYVGVWPVLPLFPYIKIGNRDNSEACKQYNIELNIEIIPDPSSKYALPHYKISEVYILKDEEKIYPIEKDSFPILIKGSDYVKEDNDDYASYSKSLSFPFTCKDLNNSKLIIEKIRENDKPLADIEIELEYKKATDKVHGIFVFTAFKIGLIILTYPFR